MPIGTGIIYNVGDLILSQVSGSGTAFLETKIAAATSSIIYFDSNGAINSASLNSITVGTSSYVSGSRSIITNLTASNISASGTISASLFVGSHSGSTFGTSSWASNALTASFLPVGTYNITSSWAQNVVSASFATTAQTANALNTANSYTITNLTASNISASLTGSFGIVGIGTVNPAYKLDVVSPDVAVSGQPGIISRFSSGVDGRSLIRVVNTSNNNTAQAVHAGISFVAYATSSNQPSTNTHEAQIMLSNGTTGGTNDLKFIAPQGMTFWVSSSNVIMTGSGYVNYGTQAIAITPGGFVGIGTASPGALLEVSSSTAASLLNVKGAGGNAILFVSGSGNVGIGTSNPLDKLSISGSIGLYAAGSTRIYNAINATDTISIEGAGGITFKTYSGGFNNAMFINTAGNVGIGTTSPKNKLSVIGSDSTLYYNTTAPIAVFQAVSPSTVLVAVDGNVDGYYAELKLGNAQSTYYPYSAYIRGIQGAGIDYYRMEFGTANGSAAATRMTIATDGNIGIGITNPTAKLHVSGSSIITNPNPAANSAVLLVQDNGTATTVTSGTTLRVVNDGSSANYSVFEASSGVSNFVILNNGNIGIGTTSPGYKLTIQNDAASTNALLALQNLTASATTNHGVSILPILSDNTGSVAITAGGLYWLKEQQWTNDTTSRDSYLRIDTTENNSASEKVRITSAGNVGIGTNSPTQKLEVQGNGQFGNDSVNNVGLKLTRLNGGIRTSEHTYHSSQNSPWYTYGQNLTWTNELAGTVEPTQVYRPYFEGFAPAAGYKVFGFMDVTTGSFTSTNVVNSLVLKNDGNVGIGTTGPFSKLDVRGNLYVNYGVNGTGYIQTNGSDSDLQITTATNLTTLMNTGGSAGLAFGAGNSERMRILSGGNVGIGTTNPAYLLDVSGSSRHGYRTADNHYFTGSVNISGSLNATASWATNALTASFLPVGTYNITSSWANNVVSASFATTAQTANALNTSNTYTVAGLTSAYVDVNGSATIPSTGIYRPSSKTLGLSADSTLILKINGSVSPYVTSIESGNVGIGSSNPTSKFEVLTSAVGLANQPNIIGNFRGDTDGRSLIRVDNTSTSAGAAALQAGISFVAYSNVSSQPSANKHEAQIILGSTGATSVTGGQTGTLQIVAPQDIAFNVSASNTIMTGSNYTAFGYNAMYIARSGNVGIGTTSPGFKLDVSGSGANARIGNAEIGQWPAATAYTYFGHEALDHSVGGNYAVVQSSAGETFINSATGQVMHFSVGNSEKVQINSSGNVGINTQGAAITSKLMISGSGTDSLLLIKSPISGAILYVSGSGAVGIGTSNVGAFTLQVSGSFGATTKSFIIDHPTKAGKKLMYGSLESPYHGIRLTGRDTLVNGKCKVELPDYIYKLILHDSVNIQLTGIKCNKTLYVDDINIPENYFTIAYDKAIFESYKDYDFFWDFTAIRADVPELTTEL